MVLPLASVDKLIRKAGAHRVSEGAARELGAHLQDTAIEVAREAITLASHAGRKTVKAEDIRLAQKRLFG
jgi:histone H3/H4